MKIELILNAIENITYALYNNIKKMVKYPKYKKLLITNAKFKNLYIGKRCFILGNGPSLKDVDFLMLRDEYTFTVNQLSRNSHFPELNTNFHVWTDPIFFDLKNEIYVMDEYIDNIRRVNTENNTPNVFLPVQAKEFIEKYELNKLLKISYIHTCLTFHDTIENQVDFTKLVPSFSTVIINTIMLASYMGFNEIYLLGCDCTSITGAINKELGKNVNNYAYQINENDKKIMSKDFEEEFNICSRIFHQYKWISSVCKKRGIKLVNCSNPSILNVIEYQEILSVMGKK